MEYSIQFPDPEEATDDGLLAIGGELNAEFLESAYKQGIFPWFDDESPIMWWSPDPRLVLYPNEFKVSKSLAKVVKNNKFELKIDTDFLGVINNCANIKRTREEGTWITKDIINAYNELHEQGIVHSFETYRNNELVGGLYGVSYGKAFFGESMFHKETDASKVALFYLVDWCKLNNFHFIDAQQSTDHLKSLGAREIKRSQFMDELKKALNFDTIKRKWD